MQIDTFKRIVTTFADPQTEILIERDRTVVQVNGNLIEVTLKLKSMEVFVVDGGHEMPANQWVLVRLAQLPLLADRLISTVPVTRPFVTPEADLQYSLEVMPGEESEHVSDALDAALNAIDNRSPLETTVLYITSDAGEGKTSLINEIARRQAERFKSRTSDWLLVPIPLGGRHFLRFDDITVGALQNRYRFPFLYYNAFLELVRLGVLVPAYDGFEEMFVENTSGEALSAMGILVNSLQSSGAFVVAARKAYYEFQNLNIQVRLRDVISGYLVGFGKLALNRWKKAQFLAYCEQRHLPQAGILYDKVVLQLKDDHPLISRPVLVRRLVDIAERSSSIDDFLLKLQSSGGDFFSVFIAQIVEREAKDVWIDRSGDAEVKQPLLTFEEHCQLLALLAAEMWQTRVGFLRTETLEFITDYFCEIKRKSAGITIQVRERIKGHALLIASSNNQSAVEFDHDAFRQFFLGEAIAQICITRDNLVHANLLNVLRKAVLPDQAFQSVIHALKRISGTQLLQVMNLFAEVASLDGQASFTHENCTSILLGLLNGVDGIQFNLKRMSFSLNSFREIKLSNISFEFCYFSQTSLEHTTLKDCRFENCHFARLDAYDTTELINVVLNESPVDVLSVLNLAVTFFEPNTVRNQLQNLGFTIPETTPELALQPVQQVDLEEPIIHFERLRRCFMRSTHISKNVILRKLGNRANSFMEEILPVLLRTGIFIEIEHRGGGSQRHFKLGRPMVALTRALEQSGGSFERFIEEASRNIHEERF